MESQKQSSTKSLSGDLIVQEVTTVNGERRRKVYEKVRVLGKGGFAMCYLVRNQQTNTMAAAKVISKSILKNVRTRYKLENEIKVHKTLHHPNIVQLYVSFEDQQNVYLLLEVCSGESLNELINRRKRFSVPQCQKYITQIVKAVEYLHSRKILHRDLKLGNIFLNDTLDVKLGDFGLATRMEYSDQKKRSVCGTPNYIAPEIILGHGYGYEVDIWSIGVILYTLLFGTPPFETDNVQDTYDLIKKNKFKYDDTISVPDQAKHLINRILNSNPSERPTLQNILDSSFIQYGQPKILKQLSNTISISRATSPSQSKIGEDYSPHQLQQSLRVVQFKEIDNGFIFSMSNGLVGAKQAQQVGLLNTLNLCYYFLRRGSAERESMQKYEGEELVPSEFERLKTILKSVKHLARECSCRNQSVVYVKRFIRHKDFYTFRLSNQTVQLKFGDGCQALINRHLIISLSVPSAKLQVTGTLEDLQLRHSVHLEKKSKYIREMVDVLAARKK